MSGMNGLSLREIKTRKSNDRYANVLEFVRRDALKNDDDTPTRKNVPRAEPLRKRLELNPPRRAFTAHSRPTPSRLSSRYVSRRIIDPEKRKDRSKIFTNNYLYRAIESGGRPSRPIYPIRVVVTEKSARRSRFFSMSFVHALTATEVDRQ